MRERKNKCLITPLIILYIKQKGIKNMNDKSIKINEDGKAARRAYRKKWQREHPEKVKEYQARYWNKKGKQAETEDSNKKTKE